MANIRTYTDEQLAAAVAGASCWSQVMRALGKAPGGGTQAVKAVAVRLGLDTSHFAYKRSFVPLPPPSLPFSQAAEADHRSGLCTAAKWFLDRGYNASVPLEPASYDLIVESDEGLKRVQVKTTKAVDHQTGRYAVAIRQMAYVTAGKGVRRQKPYSPDEVDLFFIIAPNAMYLIPIEAVAGRVSLVLDGKYAALAVA